MLTVRNLQAFRTIEKKYNGTVVGNEDNQDSATPTKKNKRTVAGGEGEQAIPTPKKRVRPEYEHNPPPRTRRDINFFDDASPEAEPPVKKVKA